MISLTDNVVIITDILILSIILWLIVWRQQTRQALYWWHHRQHIKMRQEADSIRNKTLQELFVLRRNMELSQVNNSKTYFDQKYLDHVQNIDSSLKKLSEYLYPAHLDNNLPLAIYSLLESWKSNFSSFNFHLKLPEIWDNEPEEKNRILLMIINELLNIIILSHEILPLILVATLEQKNNYNKFKLELKNSCTSNHTHFYRLPEFDYLCHIFKIITGGKCFYQQKHSTQIWHFCWYNNKSVLHTN
ncbi:unknown protein (plasmid) [Calothrix sp. PCC 7716]|nr:unknown protein [Calothrix sp. PCC 7716]